MLAAVPRREPATPAVQVRATARAGVVAVEAISNRAFGRHSHDQFGFGVMLAGAHHSASGRGPVRAEPGQLLSVNPNEVHDGHPVAGAVRHWRMLYVDPAILAPAIADVAGGEFAHPVLTAPDAARAFLALHGCLTRTSPPFDLAIDGLLLEVLAPLVARQTARPAAVPRSVQRAKDLIDTGPEATLSLDQLAATAGLSRYHFLRAFAAATGLPPHAYQMQQRLHRARQQIVRGEPLATVAAATGFADQAHLTRLFTRCYGLAPGALARAHRR